MGVFFKNPFYFVIKFEELIQTSPVIDCFIQSHTHLCTMVLIEMNVVIKMMIKSMYLKCRDLETSKIGILALILNFRKLFVLVKLPQPPSPK